MKTLLTTIPRVMIGLTASALLSITACAPQADDAGQDTAVGSASEALTIVTNDFSIGVGPASTTIAPGGRAVFNVTTRSNSSLPVGPIALTVSGLPLGVTGSFSAASVGQNGASVLTLTAAATVTAATATFTVSGRGAFVTHAASAEIVVDGITNGGFETGVVSAPWQVPTGNVGAQPDTFYTHHSHSGTYFVAVGDDVHSQVESRLYQAVKVPATGTTTLSVSFSIRALGVTNSNVEQIYVTDATGYLANYNTDFVLYNLDTALDTNGWVTRTFDLTRWHGQTVRIYFRSIFNPAWAQYFLIDDVSVTNR